MNASNTTRGRQRVMCANPSRCGVQWHYADTKPACKRGGIPGGTPPLIAIPPAEYDRPDVSTMSLPSERWDSLVHSVGTGDPDGSVFDHDDLGALREGVDYDSVAEAGGYVRSDYAEYMTAEKFYRAAAEGRRVFDSVEFAEPMGESETRGMVFSGCRFHGDVVLGDRVVLADCYFDGDVTDSAMTERGGRVSAIIENAKVGGDVKLSGSSHIALNGAEVSGDVHLRGGNGLQAVFANAMSVDGIIHMDDSEAIAMRNTEPGNVIALHGSAEALFEPGNTGGADYHGLRPDDSDDAVYVASYDDLQEAWQVPGQMQLDGASDYDFGRFPEMDSRVNALARSLHREVRNA